MVNSLSQDDLKRLELLRRAHADKKRTDNRATGANLPDPEEYARRNRARIEADARMVAAQRDAIVERGLRTWSESIGPLWRDATIDDPSMPPDVRAAIVDRVNRWASGNGRHHTTLIFYGPVGRGKTWCAYALAHEMIRRNLLTPAQVRVFSEQELAEIADSGYLKAQKMDELRNSSIKLFIFDDVGRGNFRTPAERGSMWFEVINHVYSNNLAMVITANLKADAFEGWFGAASTDRLRVMTGSEGAIEFSNRENMRRATTLRREKEYRR